MPQSRGHARAWRLELHLWRILSLGLRLEVLARREVHDSREQHSRELLDRCIEAQDFVVVELPRIPDTTFGCGEFFL